MGISGVVFWEPVTWMVAGFFWGVWTRMRKSHIITVGNVQILAHYLSVYLVLSLFGLAMHRMRLTPHTIKII